MRHLHSFVQVMTMAWHCFALCACTGFMPGGKCWWWQGTKLVAGDTSLAVLAVWRAPNQAKSARLSHRGRILLAHAGCPARAWPLPPVLSFGPSIRKMFSLRSRPASLHILLQSWWWPFTLFDIAVRNVEVFPAHLHTNAAFLKDTQLRLAGITDQPVALLALKQRPLIRCDRSLSKHVRHTSDMPRAIWEVAFRGVIL